MRVSRRDDKADPGRFVFRPTQRPRSSFRLVETEQEVHHSDTSAILEVELEEPRRPSARHEPRVTGFPKFLVAACLFTVIAVGVGLSFALDQLRHISRENSSLRTEIASLQNGADEVQRAQSELVSNSLSGLAAHREAARAAGDALLEVHRELAVVLRQANELKKIIARQGAAVGATDAFIHNRQASERRLAADDRALSKP